MASIPPVGSRQRAQVRKRGQSIAKTFKTKGAAEAWAREKEVEIDKGQNAVDVATVTVAFDCLYEERGQRILNPPDGRRAARHLFRKSNGPAGIAPRAV